jgi:hypothetical protein
MYIHGKKTDSVKPLSIISDAVWEEKKLRGQEIILCVKVWTG